MTDDLSDAYENGAYIANAAAYPEEWARAARLYRAQLTEQGLARLDLPYGDGARAQLDLFLPSGTPKGLIVFVHGGYWKAFDRKTWSDLAEGARARGWAVAMPSYDLCPDVRIVEITRQVARAVVAASAEVAGPIRLVGHSAGGHLVARIAVPGVLPDEVAARVVGVMPISPLSDLRPLMLTAMNEVLRIDPAEATSESPVLLPRPSAKVTVWVGAEERPAFLDQAKWMSTAWNCQLTISPEHHHFNVIEPLSEPYSALVEALLGLA
ncbi:alpha/beta hydrolase [Sagittula sp. NFXS13]|uniref:alpha/beta hydrolase n=1 Tax=Sagittula sp. NFXS13 TaxID=2819095 RepID=UPI0032DFC282